MKWTELLKSQVEDVYHATEGLMALVKQKDLAWKPETGSNWMTMGQLLLHITNACGFCMRGFVTGNWGMPEGVKYEECPQDEMLPPAEKMPAVKQVAKAKELLAGDKALALAMIDQAGERALATKKVAAPWNPGVKYELGLHLLHMVSHLSQHKGQLFYYLKLMGRPVHTGHLWGM
jgi:uncharacterized damage-inducible protein DinB